MKQVASFLNRNTRRRYLFTLILFNDREKADLDSIEELNSQLEESLVKSEQNSIRNKLKDQAKKEG